MRAQLKIFARRGGVWIWDRLVLAAWSVGIVLVAMACLIPSVRVRSRVEVLTP